MQLLFVIGTLPVTLALLVRKSVRSERSGKGILFGLLNGIFSSIGMIALFAAYRSGGNTSVVTAAGASFPVVTVLLAMVVLKERLAPIQGIGIAFAVSAPVLFSF